MANINTNIDDYTIADLFQILNLDDDPTQYQVKDATNDIIAKMKSENRPELEKFFEEVQQKILDSLDDEDLDEQIDDQTTLGNWWQNQYPQQSNETQANKATDRNQTIQTFDNNHFQMNRERLGVNNTYQSAVSKEQ